MQLETVGKSWAVLAGQGSSEEVALQPRFNWEVRNTFSSTVISFHTRL